MKNSRVILTVILLCIESTSSIAQDWQWSTHFGGPGHDWGYIGTVDAAGNIYCYGNYAGSGPGNYYNMYIEGDTLEGNKDSFIAKFDTNGNLQWVKNCSSSNGIFLVSGLALANDGNSLYLTGATSNGGELNTCLLDSAGGFLSKLDLDGNCIWVSYLGELTVGSGLINVGQGQTYLAGLSSTSGVGGQPIASGTFISEFDDAGNLVWVKELVSGLSANGNTRYSPYQLKYHNGSILVHGAAFQYSNSGPWQVDTVVANVVVGGGHMLMNLDASNGVARWVKPLGFSTVTQNTVLRQLMDVDASGTIHCAGTVLGGSARFGTDTILSVPTGGNIAYLNSYSPDGTLERLRTFYGGVAMESIVAEDDGSFLVSADFSNSGGSLGACTATQQEQLLWLDSVGNCLAMSEIGDVFGLSLIKTSSGIYVGGSSSQGQQFGNFLFAGESYTSYGFNDIVLGKHDLQVGVSTMQGQGNEQLVIYANPNQGTFRIKVPDAFLHRSGLLLKVIDSEGRIVHDQTLNLQGESPRMDLFDVSPGYYLVTLGNSERTYSGHMVVE